MVPGRFDRIFHLTWVLVDRQLLITKGSHRSNCLSSSSRYDSKCSSSAGPHDVLHSVSNRIFVPVLHSVLCAEGILRCLCYHILAELRSLDHQLQTTSILERGLETAAPTQTGLTALQTFDWQFEGPASIYVHFTVKRFFLKKNYYSYHLLSPGI